MIPVGDLVLLDTNVLVQLIRQNAAGQRIARELSLPERAERPLISVVTVGEMHSLARKLGWGEAKRARLGELIRQLVIIDIHAEAVIERYAQIDHHSEKVVKPARPLGQNDMWIAASASVYDAYLITTDDDFDHLTPDFLKRVKVDSNTGAVLAD